MNTVGGWRRARGTNNYVKDSKVLAIHNKYKVNTLVGYMVTLYDFNTFVSRPQGKVLKTFTKKSEAIKYRREYMRKH